MMKRFKLMLILVLFSTFSMAQNSISVEDTKLLVGNWTGSLTYIDYSSEEPYTMPANLIVEKGKTNRKFKLQNVYPNEPKANNRYKLSINADGTEIDGEKIISVNRKENGITEITTENTGKDNNKKALIRMLYSISEKELIFRKLVKYEDSEEWMMRNEFSYRKAN